MKRHWPSVTRRHIEFLFGPSNVKQVRAVERIIKRNREETVVSYEGAMCRCDRCCSRIPWDDTELQLPPSDESKVGDDV